MSHIIGILLLTVTAVILLAVSYIIRYITPWMSGIIQSIGLGVITGLIVYVLGNMRSAEEKYLVKTSKTLEELLEMEDKIMAFWKYRDKEITISNRECADVLKEAISVAIKYLDIIGKLDHAIFKKIKSGGYFDYNEMKVKVKDIQTNVPPDADASTYVKIGIQLSEIIQDASYFIFSQNYDVRIKLDQIYKYPF